MHLRELTAMITSSEVHWNCTQMEGMVEASGNVTTTTTIFQWKKRIQWRLTLKNLTGKGGMPFSLDFIFSSP